MLPILLTASVETRGMKGAKFSAREREKMYVDTLNYYISDLSKRKGDFILVFAENSGWDMNSITEKLVQAENVCIEYEALSPELFDQSKGKSYNEMLILDLVTERNKSIRNAGGFFKLTGRFPILNLYQLMKEVDRRNHDGQIRLYQDCKDHNVYEWLHLPINGHAADCRYFAISLDFYDKYIRGKYKLLNDYDGKCVEWLFLLVIREHKNESGVYGRFRTQAHFTGSGGHSLGNGNAFFYSTNNDSTIMKIKRNIRQVLRWIIPWWWV